MDRESEARRRRPSVRAVVSPAAILLGAVAVSSLLLRGQPEARTPASIAEPPLVRVLPVAEESVRLRVVSQGTVAPRTESELVAEVPGRIVRVYAGLEPGAFFRKGDLLAEFEPRDLELAVRRSRAALARVRAEEDYAQATFERQRALRRRGIASAAVVDESERAWRIAEARRHEAEVDLERAERDVARTRIVAPFDGRTRTRSIDVGAFAPVGKTLAQVYAEVRLPIPDREMAYLDLPLGAEFPVSSAPKVVLTADFAAQQHRWTGRIVRTEAEIDPRTRMVHVIARVAQPYQNEEGPPLAAGLFVEAEIIGRRVEGVMRVPRAALAGEDAVWVVDADDRLRRQEVEVLRLERDEALIVGGLDPRERVSLLEPRLARDGIAVRPVGGGTLAEAAPTREPAS